MTGGIFLKKRLTAFLCVILALFAGFFLSRIPEEERESEADFKIRQIKEDKSYILKDYEGRLALFIKGNIKPHMIFNVYTDNLPDMDKFKLKEGIEVKEREELRSLLEDLTS